MKKFFCLLFLTFISVAGVLIAVGCFDVATHTHNYEYETTVYPTCQRDGYDVFRCVECGSEENKNFTPKIPHEFLANVTTTEPTCEDQGYCSKTCIYCGCTEKYDFTKATGHETITIKGYAPTCIKKGLTDGEKCIRCGKVLVEQKEIESRGHKHVIVKKGTEATCFVTGLTDRIECTVCGKVLQEQTIIPVKHSDGNSDSFCDKCHALFGDDIIEINTEQQLKNISYNLNGKYKLNSDIVLTGTWIPLGTPTTPFTGKFDGGNHTISNLTVSNNLAGLFGYNSGDIENLKIDAYSYDGTFSHSQWDYAAIKNLDYGKEEIFAGAVCGVNKGIIKNCNLSGALSVNCSTDFVLGVKNPYPTGSAYYEFFVGGLAGKNFGDIDGCSIIGTVNFNYSNTAKYYVDRNVFTGMQLGAGYKKFVNSMTVNFGWVTGYNSGKTVNCAVKTESAYNVSIEAHQDGFGNAIAENVLNLGSAIGFNNGIAESLNAPAISLSPKVTLTATPPWSGQVGEYCNSFNNMELNVGKSSNGIIGNE